MKNKILIGLSALGTTIALLPLFAAFEAHVINVTATIENALSVPIEGQGLTYGEVFPQEALDQKFDVSLSSSFLSQNNIHANDVEYMIRQKPKCGLPIVDTNPTQYSKYGQVTEDGNGGFKCVDEGYVQLPLLCPYLSKHEITTDGANDQNNDGPGINSFHGITSSTPVWNLATTVATQVTGMLDKEASDTSDTWNIDLHAPCFKGSCAQDWASFVHSQNPDADPVLYEANSASEHQQFGCDLWLEVTGINNPAQ
jgi:hypothetical protein